MLPLPPSDAPLAAQLDALMSLAEAGEPVAACRLALDSVYCQDYERNRSFMNQVTTGLAPRLHRMSDDLAAGLIVGTEEKLANGADYCADLSAKTLPSMDSLLEQALPRLNARQKVLLVLSRPDGSVARLIREPMSGSRSGGDTRFVYSQFLADHGMEFLKAGIAAADPLALEGMILVHAPSRVPDRGLDVFLSLPDPYQFAGFALLMQELNGPTSLGPYVSDVLESVLVGIPPNDTQQLQASVKLEARRWQNTESETRYSSAPKTLRSSSLCSD
jgi:hypothetical protein